MANYYTLVSTHIEKERKTFYTDTQLPDLKLSIGWGEVNPLCKSQAEIKRGIEEFYPEYKSTVNPDNGAKSLTLFIHLGPGDIVFVRGNAEIIDVALITGPAFFDRTGHYPQNYFLKIPFVPLFSDKYTVIKTADVPDEIYNEVLYDGGRSIVVRKLSQGTARKLLTAIANKLN